MDKVYQHKEIGARVIFEGIVREQEDGDSISGLQDAYESMATKKLQSIGKELIVKHSVESLLVIHRVDLYRLEKFHYSFPFNPVIVRRLSLVVKILLMS